MGNTLSASGTSWRPGKQSKNAKRKTAPLDNECTRSLLWVDVSTDTNETVGTIDFMQGGVLERFFVCLDSLCIIFPPPSSDFVTTVDNQCLTILIRYHSARKVNSFVRRKNCVVSWSWRFGMQCSRYYTLAAVTVDLSYFFGSNILGFQALPEIHYRTEMVVPQNNSNGLVVWYLCNSTGSVEQIVHALHSRWFTVLIKLYFWDWVVWGAGLLLQADLHGIIVRQWIFWSEHLPEGANKITFPDGRLAQMRWALLLLLSSLACAITSGGHCLIHIDMYLLDKRL